MDRVYRMLKESRHMTAAAAGVAVKDDEEDSAKLRGLTVDEKLFLQAVERGDTETARRYVELVRRANGPVRGFNINCVDPLGRLAAAFL